MHDYDLHTHIAFFLSYHIPTAAMNDLFQSIITLSADGGGGGGGDDDSGGGGGVMGSVKQYQAQVPPTFNMVVIEKSAEEALADPSQTPYVLVLLQEITRMNVLLSYMKTSLDELGTANSRDNPKMYNVFVCVSVCVCVRAYVCGVNVF